MLKTKPQEETSTYRSDARASDVPSTNNLPSLASTASRTGEDRRVRPEELAEAIRALEKRHQTISPGTLPLTDAVKELDSPFTSEEIWQEIQSSRVQPTVTRKKKTANNLFSNTGIGVIAVAAVIMAVTYVAHTTWQERQPVQQLPPGGQQNFVKQDIFYQGIPFFIHTPQTKPFGEIKDGQAFSMDPKSISSFTMALNGLGGENVIPASQVQNLWIDMNPRRQQFDIVKIDGKPYVRGYVREKLTVGPDGKLVSLNADPTIEQKGFYVFTSRPIDHTTVTKIVKREPLPANATRQQRMKWTESYTSPADGGPANIQVQIPLESFGFDNLATKELGDAVSTRIAIGRLDKHAWEPWNPLPPPPTTKAK